MSYDETTLYVVVKSGSTQYYGYLLGLDSSALTTKYKVFLKDPRNGNNAAILDDSTASPSVAPVSITSTPAIGYIFSNWTGSLNGSYSGATNPVSIVMGAPITEVASFSQ